MRRTVCWVSNDLALSQMIMPRSASIFTASLGRVLLSRADRHHAGRRNMEPACAPGATKAHELRMAKGEIRIRGRSWIVDPLQRNESCIDRGKDAGDETDRG